MSDRILSAFEKAMERFQSRAKNLPADHFIKSEYIPVGCSLAARYLHESDFNLCEAISGYTDPTVKKYVLEGTEKFFLDSITLPEDEEREQINKRVLDAFYQIKKNKPALDQIVKELLQLLNYYRYTKDKTMANMKNSLIQHYRQISHANLDRLPYAEQQRIHQEINQHYRQEKASLLRDLASKFNPELERLKKAIKDIQ